MSKMCVVNVRYYIPINEIDELDNELKEMGITDSEYYGGHEIVDVEDEEE